MTPRVTDDFPEEASNTEVTLLDLVRTVAEITCCEKELVTTVRHLIETGQIFPASSPNHTKVFHTG